MPPSYSTPLYISPVVPRPISPNLLARNSTAVQAITWQAIAARLAHALKWRRKQLWRSGQSTQWLGKGVSTRVRWRGRARTGTLCAQVAVRLQIALLDTTSGDPKVTIAFTAVGGGTSPTLTVHAGSGSTVASDVTSESWIGVVKATVDASKAYTIDFTEVGNCRLISASVYEIANETLTSNGYPLMRFGVGGPIYDADRETMLTAATAAWKANGAVLFDWSVQLDSAPRTSSSTVNVNVVDISVLTVSVASPGIYVNLEHCNTVSQATVPVEFAVRAQVVGAGLGTVAVFDSAGAVVSTLSVSVTTTLGWYTVTGFLPATEAKYDVRAKVTGVTTISIWGFALAQYQA